MNLLLIKTTDKKTIVMNIGLFLILMSFGSWASGMMVSGQITASTVTVSGAVTTSSVTATNISVTHLLRTLGTVQMPGRVGQIVQKSSCRTAIPYYTTSSTFTAISSMTVSLALSNATDYFRISLSGVLSSQSSRTSGFLTIKRDSTDLGNTDPGSLSYGTGLALAVTEDGGSGFTYFEVWIPVGIVITDSPGDTNIHNYQVFIKSTDAIPVAFPNNSLGYLLVEEVSR